MMNHSSWFDWMAVGRSEALKGDTIKCFRPTSCHTFSVTFTILKSNSHSHAPNLQSGRIGLDVSHTLTVMETARSMEQSTDPHPKLVIKRF